MTAGRPRKPKPPPKPIRHPLEVIRRAKEQYGVKRVALYTSTGKDSAATLALCREHFDAVQCFFMYLVPGLSFQETYLRYLERTFDVKINRIPHWMLSGLFRGASLRHPTQTAVKMRNVKISHVDAYIRKTTGIHWLASGERAQDSVERNAMLRQCDGISVKRGRIFPLTFWTTPHVFSYLKQKRIALPADYGAGLPTSFGSLWYRELAPIKERFPEDYAKICKQFPLVPAQLFRYEERERKRTTAALKHAEAKTGATIDQN